MTCERCHQSPAQVQFTEVVAGEKRVQWLCPACASASGLIWTTNSTLDVSIVASAPSPAPAAKTPAPRRRCEGCGTTLAAIRRTGRVGCPECYQTFRSHLDPLMKRVHRSLDHVGHVPSRRDEGRHLRRLREELAQAIAHEDYEEAARLRDAIRGASPAAGEPEGLA